MAITRIKQLRNSIEKLTKWEKSGKAFGFIDDNKNLSTDYIYEFYCAMRILKDLNTHQSVKIEPGNNGKYNFPRKPANKGEWAKFLIREKATLDTMFQFCLGTVIKVSISPLTTFGADISLQTKNAPDDPDASHVIWIMDGKHKKSKLSKLDIDTIRGFAKCVSDMNAPKNSKSKLQFNKLGDLNTNCLLTNGEGVQNHKQYCKNNRLKQIGKFDCDGRTMEVIG
jgi:hypothetical protein